MNNILRIKNFVLAHEFLETSSTQLSQDFLFITIYNLFCAKYSVPLFWTFKVRFDFDLKWQITFFYTGEIFSFKGNIHTSESLSEYFISPCTIYFKPFRKTFQHHTFTS